MNQHIMSHGGYHDQQYEQQLQQQQHQGSTVATAEINGETDYPYGQQQQQYDASTSQKPPPSDGSNNHHFAAEDSMSAAFGLAGGEASHLDHALLESLFYNEMALLDASSSNGDENSDFFSHHLAEATFTERTTHPPLHDTAAIVEKEILRDFGVGTPQRGTVHVGASGEYGTNAAINTAAATVHWQHHHHAPGFAQPSLQDSAAATSPLPSAFPRHPPHHHPYPPPTQYSHPPTHLQNHPAATQTRMYSAQDTTTATMPTQPPLTAQFSVGHSPATAVEAAPMYPPPISANNNNHHDHRHHHPYTSINPSTSTTDGLPPLPPPLRTEPPVTDQHQQKHLVVRHDRAQQLVDQFATLAARLGIDLPHTVLQSLTAAAARNVPSLVQQKRQPVTSLGVSTTTMTPVAAEGLTTVTAKALTTDHDSTNYKAHDENAPQGGNANVMAVAPTVEELRKTAEEAIAAVTRKRSFEHQDSAGSDGGNDESIGNEAANNDNDSGGIKPAYSKRRKKPRLADCESKLAQLKAENEHLKRHLETVSNKAYKFDKEKVEAGKRIAQLMHRNAGPDEMVTAVREFSDMYSDYGVNRQKELSFHLEQLQRLVNPTNFTKMGLWTLGQSFHDPKRNPIAGILVKELTITPQQGRKILDQSEKIRKLCDNLKETHALLVKLKTLCEEKTQLFQDRMSKCTQILTSQQVVKLISWINEHTQLLETICPGWGTEQIISSKKPAPK